MKDIDLEKTIWREDDFETMEWHDCKVYAIAFDDKKFELAFDIDYILKWINPKGESNYKFWISPATLVFRNVYDININLSSVGFQIQEIHRSNPTKPKNAEDIEEPLEYNWTIETTNGEIILKSVGYKLYIRQKPKLIDNQFLDIPERGGIAFDTIFT